MHKKAFENPFCREAGEYAELKVRQTQRNTKVTFSKVKEKIFKSVFNSAKFCTRIKEDENKTQGLDILMSNSLVVEANCPSV